MRSANSQTFIFFVILISTSCVLHFKIFSLDIIGFHAWRQTQTQTITDNFYEESMNILNPRVNCRGDGEGIYRTDFPLLQWCIAATYFIFGEHIVVSRVFIFILGLCSTFLFYKSLVLIFGYSRSVLAGTWAFAFSPLLYYYTMNPLPDNLCFFFLCWFLYLFLLYTRTKKQRHLFSAYIVLCLATIVKLPFGIYFILPFIYITAQQPGNFFRKLIGSFPAYLTMLFSLTPAIAWYVWVIPQMEGNPVLAGVFDDSKSTAQYGNYIRYYITEIVPGILLNYILVPVFIAGLYFIFRKKIYTSILSKSLLGCCFLLCMYILFEANVLAYAHDYYFFPFLPILFIIVTFGIQSLFALQRKIISVFLSLLILALPLTAFARMQGRWSEKRPSFNRNLYEYKNDLKNAVPADALVVTGNDDSRYIWLYHLDKKGWNFKNDSITPAALENMIEHGARYLYSDSKKTEDPAFQSLFDTLIMQRGNVKVYRLTDKN